MGHSAMGHRLLLPQVQHSNDEALYYCLAIATPATVNPCFPWEQLIRLQRWQQLFYQARHWQTHRGVAVAGEASLNQANSTPSRL